MAQQFPLGLWIRAAGAAAQAAKVTFEWLLAQAPPLPAARVTFEVSEQEPIPPPDDGKA